MFFGPSFMLFRAAGFPVSAHWSLFVALGLIAYSYGSLAGGLTLGGLLFSSVLLHELGHAVVARARRVPIEGIELHLFGGVAKMTAPPRSPKDEIAIAIAGPLVSLGLAGLGLGAAALYGAAAPGWLAWFGGVNLLLGLFNLLPALPMDGGRVFRALLARRKGLVGGTRLAVKVSRGIAVGLAVLGLFFNAWLIALALLVWMLGSAELAEMHRHEVLARHGYSDDFDPWARYERATRRGRALEPEVLAPEAPAGGQAYAQRLVRDPLGNWVVVTEPVYR